MIPKKIKSLQHPFVKHCVRLRKEKAYRHENNQVFVSGKKIIEQVSKAISPAHILSLSNKKGEVQVTEEILKKVTGLKESDGMAAIFPLPQAKKWKKKNAILVLDRIQNPGNLGTLLRTACALQFDGAILTPETIDPYNDKAIRASSGASFFLPLIVKSAEEIIEWIQKEKVHAYIADLKGKAVHKLKVKTPFVLILSHEGQGVAPWPVKQSQKVNIPIQRMIESLNVASAGSILMYEMVKEET